MPIFKAYLHIEVNTRVNQKAWYLPIEFTKFLQGIHLKLLKPQVEAGVSGPLLSKDPEV